MGQRHQKALVSAGLAQLMAAGKENPYKVKAYQRAAQRIRTFSDSIDELVHENADLTGFPGIGDAIAACITSNAPGMTRPAYDSTWAPRRKTNA
jgi:DNA polymerase/3'-5' exonuclease PolX